MNTAQFDVDIALRFSIFNDDNRFDWDPHLRYAREQTLYPPDLSARYVRAMIQYRQLLGESFLRQVRYTHPLTNMILEPGLWQIQLLCEYFDLLQHLAVNDPGYSNLREKLLSPVETKKQAMYFLQIGHMLRSAGLDIRFPAEIKNQKNPDVGIVDPDTGQIVKGEVSRLAATDPKSVASASFATPANGHLNTPIELPANCQQFFLPGHQTYTALSSNVLSSKRSLNWHD